MNTGARSDRQRFAQRLRALRVPRGYKTARSLADDLGIHENRYTRYERAEVEPDIATLMAICRRLKVTPNDLLCEADETDHAADARRSGVEGFSEDDRGSFDTRADQSATNLEAYSYEAEVMALAIILAEISVRGDGEREPEPSKVLRTTGDLYRQIIDAPFSILPEIGNIFPIHSAALELQKRIAAHIAQILNLMRGIEAPDAKSS
ncbi:MAG: helix-turn-helix domain-containing protein [Hyphomicrobiaceae bacterium]